MTKQNIRFFVRHFWSVVVSCQIRFLGVRHSYTKQYIRDNVSNHNLPRSKAIKSYRLSGHFVQV